VVLTGAVLLLIKQPLTIKIGAELSQALESLLKKRRPSGMDWLGFALLRSSYIHRRQVLSAGHTLRLWTPFHASLTSVYK